MRKRACLYLLLLSSSFQASAQLADGSTAPDFTFQDVNGGTHNLYTYLNQGKIVALDISATWCVPCWNYRNTKVFDSLYTLYDIPGTQTWKTLFIEGDPNTNMADLQGTGSNTEGDWVTGAGYSIIAPAAGPALTEFRDNYALSYYPTFYLICPNKKVYEVKIAPALSKWSAAAVTNCTPAGIDNFEDVNPLSVFPNPAKEEVRLYFSMNNSATVKLRLTTMTGQIIEEKPYGLMQAGDQTIKYDLSRLSPGIYFITLAAGNSRSVTKKLVVR